MIQRGENAWQDVKRGAAIIAAPLLNSLQLLRLAFDQDQILRRRPERLRIGNLDAAAGELAVLTRLGSQRVYVLRRNQAVLLGRVRESDLRDFLLGRALEYGLVQVRARHQRFARAPADAEYTRAADFRNHTLLHQVLLRAEDIIDGIGEVRHVG